MHRSWKIWLFALIGALLLAACQAQLEQPQGEPESDAVVQEAVELVTAVPDTPIPTEAAAIVPTETKVVAVPSSEPEPRIEVIEPPPGQTVNDYTNVSYTQVDADLIGKTNRAQFVLTYATW